MIKGSIVALVTPFKEDGSVDFYRLERLIEFHIENKTDGFVVLGTTGEAATMSDEEQEAVAKFSIDKINGRKPVILGAGSNCTQKTIDKGKRYTELGADYLLIVTPYYNKTNEPGMLAHFETIADNVGVPVILYNVPSRTGCNISIPVLAKLSQHPNIIGIKEASGDMSYSIKVARYLSDNFVMYSGNDDNIVPMMSIGAYGVISVLANIMPKEVHDLVMNYVNGDTQKALAIQLKTLPVITALFYETNPIPVKAAMDYLNLNAGPVRLPLFAMTEENKQRLENILNEYAKGVE